MNLYFDRYYGFIIDCTPEEALEYIKNPQKVVDIFESFNIPKYCFLYFYRMYFISVIRQLSFKALEAMRKDPDAINEILPLLCKEFDNTNK